MKRFCDRNPADADLRRRDTFKKKRILRLLVSDKIKIAQRCIPFIMKSDIGYVGIQWDPAAGCLLVSRNILRTDREYGDDQVSLCLGKKFSDFSPEHRF